MVLLCVCKVGWDFVLKLNFKNQAGPPFCCDVYTSIQKPIVVVVLLPVALEKEENTQYYQQSVLVTGEATVKINTC